MYVTDMEAIRARHSVRQYLNKPLKPEKLTAVIAPGHGAHQGFPRKSKAMDRVVKVDGAMPDWFKAGREAVLLAPTAANRQKFLLGGICPAGSCILCENGLGDRQISL